MEKLLELFTEHDSHNTKIAIDNSTDFKDFKIELNRQNGPKHTLDIQLSKSNSKMPDSVTCLEIGNVSLFGREVELLKEFLNQL